MVLPLVVLLAVLGLALITAGVQLVVVHQSARDGARAAVLDAPPPDTPARVRVRAGGGVVTATARLHLTLPLVGAGPTVTATARMPAEPGP